MNWLTNYVRPKIEKLVPQKDYPDDLWTSCHKCSKMLFHKEFEENHQVCPNCGHHFRLPPLKRLEMMFDNGEFSVLQLPQTKTDPLNFTDIKKYSERIKSAVKKTKQQDAVIVAHGTMGGFPVVTAVFNFDFMGGSMGTAVGEAILTASNLAILQEASLVVIPCSGGARMQEGMLSLMQMPRTVLAVKQLREKHRPYITVLTNPTAGGVTASFAMLGDVALAEPDAVICFAGARVIEQTIHEKLPEGFQKSEFLLKHGMLDMVVERNDMRDKIITIIDLLTSGKRI
ncbi:MAG: acetyl-CoA carboxylase carboxyltransferase subunit beta [Alphaproteobacteria bacterium]|nr:acetyl-CoA carboxylase carboxyltransferase subunit beta [Alphaproteobacteria bacterium]